MISYATIGTSAITEKFISAARLDDRFFHSAVYSRNRDTGDSFAEKVGCRRVITDLNELAKDSEIEAVYIASPNSLHFSQSRLLLEHKKHVICEKPICCSAEEYSILKDLADENGVVYMEAIISINTDWHNELKSAVKKVGKIAMARFDYCQRSSRYDAFMAGEKQNIFDMSLHAGCLMDLGIYCVYGALDLLGRPDNIDANASFLYNGADGSGCAVFDYNDFQAVLSYSKTGQSAIGSEIVGDEGTLKIGLISQYGNISLIKNDGTEEIIYGMPDRNTAMIGEVRHFGDIILKTEGSEKYYEEISELAFNVLSCMDEIKSCAGIIYK